MRTIKEIYKEVLKERKLNKSLHLIEEIAKRYASEQSQKAVEDYKERLKATFKNSLYSYKFLIERIDSTPIK